MAKLKRNRCCILGGRHLTVHDDGQKAVKQRLKFVISGGNQFVENDNQQICMRSGEERNVDDPLGDERPVQPDPEISFSAQQKDQKDSHVNKTDSC